MADASPTAIRFILYAVQDWGQGEGDRIAATQAVLNAAGFDAQATCGPVFGAIWPHPCEGGEGETATAWLRQITEEMPRGKFEIECAHVDAAIAARRELLKISVTERRELLCRAEAKLHIALDQPRWDCAARAAACDAADLLNLAGLRELAGRLDSDAYGTDVRGVADEVTIVTRGDVMTAPMRPHWTDSVTEYPIFTTRINATGSRVNINEIAFTAASYLQQLELGDRGEKLLRDVKDAPSHEAAIALVERWFPVDRDDEEVPT